MSKFKYYIFNKPFGVLCQFTKEMPNHITLKDYLDLASDIYPIGRLDKDSEGLLLLTNDNKYKHNILSPDSYKTKSYWVQVDGQITENAIADLINGVKIKLKKNYYHTQKCTAHIIDGPVVWERIPPVRVRKSIPTSWLSITISEGKNRQVRKMCAAVGFPVLRLIRYEINGILLDDLPIGDFKEFFL
ncbi:MAG: pseudouridine synthase [Saprospiraceae bacterium]